VFVAWSDDGARWSAPTMVNDDPGRYDDWLPEVAVSRAGRPYVAWLDWRDRDPSECGGDANVFLARSDDGGESWVTLGPVTEVATSWSRVVSNLIPNQGDYLSLFAGGEGVHVGWADGRDGDPDAWYARHDLTAEESSPFAPLRLALTRVAPNPGHGELVVTFATAVAGAGSLELFDLTGRRALEIARGSWSPGSHTVRSAAAARLRSGIYFLRLVQGKAETSAPVAIVR
jgi:hypothetical protein